MLGYFKPYKEELKVKDVRKYSAYYCSLCHAISARYGLFFRSVLSNDAVFLMICLDGVMKEKKIICGRCPLCFLKSGCSSVNGDVADYAAFVNMYLTERYLIDHEQDASNHVKKTIFKLLHYIVKKNRQYQTDLDMRKELVEKLNKLFAEVDILEKSEDKSFDEITNLFGEVTKQLVIGFSDNTVIKNEDALEVIFFNMGKWIYLADAIEDYKKDIKTNQFNLLKTIRGINWDSVDAESQYVRRSALIMTILSKKMHKAFSEVTWENSGDIVENIISEGVGNAWKQIVCKQYGVKIMKGLKLYNE